MGLGYDGKLYILAFDHRGSFQKKWFGIEGDPSPQETERIADGKRLIYEGLEAAVEPGGRAGGHRRAGGRAVRLRRAPAGPRARAQAGDAGGEERAERVRLPVRRRVRRAHRELRPRLLQGARPLQPGRRRGHERAPDRAPAPPGRLAARARPQVPVRAAGAGRGPTSSSRWAATPTATTPSCGPSSCAARSPSSSRPAWRPTSGRSRAWTSAPTARCWPASAAPGGRDGVVCVLLGRGADDDKVDHWLTQAAPVEGFVGLRHRTLDLGRRR